MPSTAVPDPSLLGRHPASPPPPNISPPVSRRHAVRPRHRKAVAKDIEASMNIHRHWTVLRLPALLVLAVLGGCTTCSRDGGFDAVQSAAGERGVRQEARWVKNDRDAADAQAEVRKLLSAPLTADTAVQ